MSKADTKTSSGNLRRVKISDETRRLYERRDKSLDNDPDAPTLPLEYWENATVGKFYRPLKTQISFRIDNDVLEWLKSQGAGHLTRINEILRERMLEEVRRH
ncbi:MAG: BrnA antitoxin family protein [Bryobacteraceae bacterium]